MSRSKLWLAFYLKIRNNDGSITPLSPLHIFKHGAQGVYNAGKPGVNKGTEQGQLIALTGSKICFESKYILRMIDGVTCNAWRLFQAVNVCVPFIKTEESAGRCVEIGKLRKKLNNLKSTLQIFTHRLAIDSLKTIAFKRYFARVDIQHLTGLVQTMQGSSSDRKMIAIIRKCLPVVGSRLTTFSTNADLKKLRLYKSDAVPHQKGMAEGGKRKTCALCSSTNKKGNSRKTTTMCKTCGVALCVTPVDNMMCYDKCHMAHKE